VVGFDDVEEAQTVTPPLTTVRQPLHALGRRAAEMLLAQLAGEEVPEQVMLPTELVVRQSCGCPSQAVLEAAVEIPTTAAKTFKAALARQRPRILADMIQAAGTLPGSIAPDWAECLLDAFVAELKGESKAVFVPALNNVLRQVTTEGGDVTSWQGVVSALRRQVLPLLANAALVSRAENLWQQARVFIGETMQRAQAYQRLQAEQLSSILGEVGEMLMTTFDVAELMDLAARELPRLGIPSCYVSLYEDPKTPTVDARLVMGYNETKRVQLEAGGQPFPSYQLIPDGLWPRERRYTMAVEPLYFRENQLGFALFEMGPRKGVVYETLRGQISSALQGALILEERRRGEDALRESEERLETILSSVQTGIVVIDADTHTIVDANPVAVELIGVPKEQIVGHVCHKFICPAEQGRCPITDLGQVVDQSERVLLNKNEERISILKSVVPAVLGGRRCLVENFVDITERKAAEAERERLLAALERRALQLQTAAEVSHAAGSILDPDELIRQVVNLVRERFDLYYAGLFLVDQTGEWTGEPGKWAVLRAGTGEAVQKMLEQGHKLEIGGASMVGWCIANRQARIALDVGEEAVRFENPLLPQTRSELALPLVSRGEAIGALTIQSAQEAAFSPEDITVLQTMADQLANAIANARLYEALAREQYLMKALMDNVPDHIYFKDTESRFLRISTALARWFGLSDASQAIGKSDFDFFTEDHARPAFEDEQRIIRTGEPMLNVEERETWPDRPDTWVSTSKMPLRDEKGNIVGTFGISRDITARKQMEIALERRAVQLQAAAEVAREAAAIRDVRQLLDRTVHLISERFGFYHAAVFMVDEQGEYAILRAASSEGGARMLARGHRLKVGEAGIVGFVAGTGEPRIALDVGEDAVYFDNPDLPGTRSEMALPLKVRGRVIGVLDVQSTEPSAFTEEDVTTLQTMADQLAIAIDNAALIERTESQLRELSRLYGEYSAGAWAKLAERAAGFVYDRIGISPTGDVSLPALDLAMQRGQTINVVEPGTGEAVLAVPLKLRGQVIGTLGLQATDSGRQWSPQEIALVEAVSEQVALALESARLFAETQRTARSMETLYEMSRALSSSLEEKDLMRAVLEGVYRALGCEYVLISTVDEAGTIGVEHGIWQGEFDTFPEWAGMARYSLDQPDIVTSVYRSGRTEVIAGWDDRLDRERYEKFGHERFLRVFMPIKIRERTLGVVEVGYDRQQKERVTDEEIQMLAAFMDQAAIALENARLFEEARQRAQREHQIYEITSRIRRSPDISTILQTTVDELGRALRTDRAVVRLIAKPPAER